MTVPLSGRRQQSVWPSIVSDDAPRLRDWLLGLGFTLDLWLASDRDGSVHHCQMDWPEGGRVVLSSTGERPTPAVPGTGWQHVVTGAPDEVFERARHLDARVINELVDQTDYPAREFTIADPDGNYWTFSTFAG